MCDVINKRSFQKYQFSVSSNKEDPVEKLLNTRIMVYPFVTKFMIEHSKCIDSFDSLLSEERTDEESLNFSIFSRVELFKILMNYIEINSLITPSKESFLFKNDINLFNLLVISEIMHRFKGRPRLLKLFYEDYKELNNFDVMYYVKKYDIELPEKLTFPYLTYYIKFFFMYEDAVYQINQTIYNEIIFEDLMKKIWNPSNFHKFINYDTDLGCFNEDN